MASKNENEEELYLQVAAKIKNKRIPILTLDSRWHELFPEHEKPSHIKSTEAKLNNLLKKQGKLVNDVKDMKKLKKRLMDEIVENMDADSSETGKLKAKKMSKSHQMIQELNDKMKDSDDSLADIPYEIKETNERLMIESIIVCYQRLNKNQHNIVRIGEWVRKTREELKNKILIKQDMEMKNNSIYTNMHDMVGPEIMEFFDRTNKEQQDNS